MSKNKTKTLQVPILARVEGEGALAIQIARGKIQSLQLQIYEPPRLFEKFLEGRRDEEVLDIVARICGICPVAYQMSAVHALEQCYEIKPTPWIREMRRLFYCGEWLESHSLHIHFLALPDFLGFKTAPEMAKKYPEEVRRGLRLQALGNDLISLFGGRSVHPVGACLGGFYKAPLLRQVQELLVKVENRLADGKALLQWVASLPLANNAHEFMSVSLRHTDEYPMNEGNIVATNGLNIPIECFDEHFKELQVPYSTALHCLLHGQPYLVGPLARVNLNFDHLPEEIKQIVQEAGIHFPSQNMYHSIVARAVEIYYCIQEAQRILQHYAYPTSSRLAIQRREGVGYGCTEAPRGLLWHSYQLDENGFVKTARIVPPTSQNQARIEEDLRLSLQQFGLSKEDDVLRAYSEMIIRNYDPCISCSTHFLTLKVARQ
ncbi:Ni/Fe hydrogenase subunit alpha [Legionella oakridgensis]|uniref:Coenzyme F420-reducing hydrogenase, alpha subunit n=2 Tax=Legionella oakridgensis TaxID=29423 RepID=W0BHA3_9GAMM|nr:nickel-dependent hydrogenase large subunit [Legionella oakridgensis]AHE68017.1 coenzyme F420-reducing hydrogenase, alpha subunit [Legionella oakridgensis ATCC 33761 = DSM 21215]ETO92446.1 coenzyme F420-reducing hydrogenase, alpha subunit [Legionella oakridgensis RV-2-2007]KTD44582.1 coenzyme F420-reducing hydrogenase, alpha subunit [Legionella oakridgensis]STY21007.1 coenzyme F420-reducing hydrogenase, alpha subunit [Legionella longbeachae]